MDKFTSAKLEELREKDESAFNEFMAAFGEGSAKKGELILSVNRACDQLYFLDSGITKQFRYKEDGKEHISWFGFKGDLVTGYKSFVTGKPSEEGVEVIEDCTYTHISKTACYGLAEKYHAVETFFRQMLEIYYIESDERLFFLQALTAKQKYDYLFKNMPHFLQRLPQKEISAFLGVTRETLSRIRKYA